MADRHLFFAETSRLPLASTSITVTVMLPVNTLLAAASPLPASVFSLLASRPMPWKDLPGKPEIVGTEALMLLVRLTLVFDLVDAEVVSAMTMVIVSPT